MLHYDKNMRMPTSSVAVALLVFAVMYFVANHGFAFPVLNIGGLLP